MSKARQLADLGNVYDDGALSNRNMVINGGFQVAQRGTTGLGSTTTTAYTLDRWFAYRGSVSQQFDSTTGKYALRWTYSSSNNTTSNFISQNIEDINCMHTRGQNVTLSFQVRVNANTWGATDFGYDIIQETTANRNPNAFSQSISNKVAASTSWQTVTKTVTVGATTTNLCITFGRDNSTNVNNDWFEIRDVQLEIGDTATPFEHRSYGDELARCQRYYQIWGAKGKDYHAKPMWIYNSTQAATTIDLPQEMRATPSFSVVGNVQNSSGGSVGVSAWALYYAGAWVGCSALEAGTASPTSFRLDADSFDSITSGGACGLYGGTDCYITLDSEL